MFFMSVAAVTIFAQTTTTSPTPSLTVTPEVQGDKVVPSGAPNTGRSGY